MTIGSAIFDNLVPVPFNMNGPGYLKSQLVNGETFELVGGAISIVLQGESNFVEKLPEEWVPNGANSEVLLCI